MNSIRLNIYDGALICGAVMSFALAILAGLNPNAVSALFVSPAIEVRLIPKVLVGTESGIDYRMQVEIANHSNHVTTIIGGENTSICSMHGCWGLTGLPLVVPPRTSSRLDVIYKCSSPGFDSREMILYTDDPTIPRLKLPVSAKIGR
jgi:hypothetical protein